MQTTTRPRENGASYAARRGHVPQLSITDDNHHVTEAIGYMYGDEDHDGQRSSKGSSVQSTMSAVEQRRRSDGIPEETQFPPRRGSIPRKQVGLERKMSNGNVIIGPGSHSRSPPIRENSWERNVGPGSPPLNGRERSPSDTANAHFPLNDIDYESSPAAVAQELSNLQALRRMSMDVGAAGDPDLPQLNSAAIPSSPDSSASEDDAARLFWVPARLHPELAPKEFKTFLDSKAEQIKRRSGELSTFTPRSNSRSSSLSTPEEGGLRRKKSMLSRQIDSSHGYQDGAERLERKRSEHSKQNGSVDPNLEELESLVSGQDPRRTSADSSASVEGNGDIILPSMPGSSLKRSTRTQYRRGGSLKGGRPDRTTYAQRAARRTTGEELPPLPSSSDVPPLPSFGSSDMPNLALTLRDPSKEDYTRETHPKDGPLSTISPTSKTHNFSRPVGLGRGPAPRDNDTHTPITFDNILSQNDPSQRYSTASMPDRLPHTNINPKTYPRPALNDQHRPVPQIVEVPPPEDREQVRPSSAPSSSPIVQPPLRHPERSSSRDSQPERKAPPPQRPGMPPKTSSSQINQQSQSRTATVPASAFKNTQNLDQPSPLPGNDMSTNNLSFIPTLTVDKRADHKTKEETKKSGWGWLLGKEDSKEKEKLEKPKAKIVKPPQSHDNTRLDVLQSSIDGKQGRESLVLDREGLKLEEERKKESARKLSGSEGKKEKESLFSSLFGGKKAKAEKEGKHGKYKDRLSPEPTMRELRPDIDFNWTRFSILEERAIYRMAHIKLANPRRALYSQVLLSNFMYSYLAKVQQMHPQMNLPTSAKQQRKQQQGTEKQTEEFGNYQRYQQQQAQQQQPEPQPTEQSQPQQAPAQQSHQQQYAPQPSFETDRDSSTAGNPMYDYMAAAGGGQRPSSRGSKSGIKEGSPSGGGYGGGHQYQQQQGGAHGQQNMFAAKDDDDDDDMW